jgi:hypothetical protein
VGVNVLTQVIERAVNITVIFVGCINRVTQFNHRLVIVPKGQSTEYTRNNEQIQENAGGNSADSFDYFMHKLN